MGGTLSAPAVLGILQGCAPDPKPNWTPSFFTEEQALTIMEMAEAIFPATETLGAKDLGVPKFIETMVGSIYQVKDRDRFMEGLAAFESKVAEAKGKSFFELESADKLALIEAENSPLKEEPTAPFTAYQRPFFWMLKELTLLGVFTTEYGATQILQYQLVPASWEACVPLSEAGEGRTYAV